jgi:chemosensory pili system protein ChpA (sensor histidine kinase/response regulator)
LVKSGNETFAFPLRLVKQVAEIPAEELGEKFAFGETEYAVKYLSKLLDLSPAPTENVLLLLIKSSDKECVLAVEEVLKTEELVIKPLGGFLSNLSEYIGATVLGDGKVVPVLDLIFLLKTDIEIKSEEEPPEAVSSPKILSVMIVDDSPSVRKINSKIIKNAGMQPFVARDGLEALEVLQLFQEPPDINLTDVEMPRMNG